MGMTSAATIEASDMTRKLTSTIAKTAIANSNADGASTTQTPSAADTPLPPLKRRKTEKIAPAKAASAIHASWDGKNPSARAAATGTAPLRTSPAKVKAAAPDPPARATLVIPIFPEPTARGSKPRSRPTMTPNGIDPIRYAAIIMSAKLNNLRILGRKMVGVTGFEPATPASRTQCSSQAELHPDQVVCGR